MKWRFEYVLSIIVLTMLAGALGGAFYTVNPELVNTIVIALVSSFSGIVSYFFIKHDPKDKD